MHPHGKMPPKIIPCFTTLLVCRVITDVINWINIHRPSEQFNVESDDGCSEPVDDKHFSKLWTRIILLILKHPKSSKYLLRHINIIFTYLFQPKNTKYHTQNGLLKCKILQIISQQSDVAKAWLTFQEICRQQEAPRDPLQNKTGQDDPHSLAQNKTFTQ